MTFAEEIEVNKTASNVPGQVASLETSGSRLDVRLRGAYITKCELTSPITGQRVSVLYADADLKKAKISATHPMMPAGPFDGIGGQHGFPRWADYDVVRVDDPAQMTLTARRSDGGLGLSKKFELSESALTTCTTITNPREQVEHTSLGEHIYFALADGRLEGLRLDGHSLDELLGEGSEAAVLNDKTLYYEFGGGEAVIDFPAGHSLRLAADFEGDSKYPLAMWMWKRPGSPSICFEPVVGVKGVGNEDNNGVTVGPSASCELTTRIDLL